MKELIYILFIAHCSLQIVNAQQPTLEWINVAEGINADAMCIDSTGNVFISGEDELSPPGFTVAKYQGSTGQQLWLRRFVGGGGLSARPIKIGCDQQGNLYVSGYDDTYLLIKYNSTGTQLWYKRFDGTWLTDFEITQNGEPIITGYVYNGSQTRMDCYTVKCNASGDTLWTNKYNNDYDESNAIDVSEQQFISLTGFTGPEFANNDILTLKYDNNGNLLWAKTYGDQLGPERGVDIVFDNNNNIFTLGSVPIPNGSDQRFCTIKYLPNGDTDWVRIYHHPENNWDVPSKIANDKNGNIIITGGCYGSDSAKLANYTTIKYNSEGMLIWANRFGWFEPVLPPPNDLFIDNFNNSYIIGRRNIAPEYNFNRFELIAIKYDESGNQKWLITYLSPDSISGGDNIIVDKNLNVYLNGTGKNNNLRGNLLIKYSQPIGIEPISNEIPEKYDLFQNYPNPFNPVTKIKFVVPKLNNVKLLLYDVLGKEVATLVNEELKPGIYEIDFNASQFSSGVYFYKLKSVDFEETKRMILIK